MSKEYQYWKVYFTYGVNLFKIEKGEDINKTVSEYLRSQNKGEPKSDRIYLLKKHKITEKEFLLS